MQQRKYTGAYEYQAYHLLLFLFVFFYVVKGIDKIVYFFTGWTKFHSEFAVQFLQGNEPGFIFAIGIVEIIIGIGVVFKPKFFSYLLVVWSLVIVLNFLLQGRNYDIALRDFSLLIAALALARLSHKYGS